MDRFIQERSSIKNDKESGLLPEVRYIPLRDEQSVSHISASSSGFDLFARMSVDVDVLAQRLREVETAMIE